MQFSDEHRRNMSIARKALWASLGEIARQEAVLTSIKNLKKPRVSKIEDKLAEWLRILKLNFVRQYRIGTYFVDFLISECNWIIECDGIYWHSQPKRVEHDIIRDRYLKDLGYTVIRITGKKILDTEKTIKSVIYGIQRFETLNGIKLRRK